MICCFPSDDENENATADCKCLSSHSNWVLSVFFIFFTDLVIDIIQTDREGDNDENDDDSYENAIASASPIFLPFHLPTIELEESLRGGFPLSQ